MQGAEKYFSRDVDTARNRFVAACQTAGIRIGSYASSKVGSKLFVDVARFGSPDSDRYLVIGSGAGGPVGYVVSGIQTACIHEGLHRNLPSRVALLLIHAISPDGPAWRSLPQMEPAVEPQRWSDSMLSNADNRYAEHSKQTTAAAPADKHGNAPPPPTWNTAVQEAIVHEYLKDSKRVLFLDIRTGPSRYGEAAVLPSAPGNAAHVARIASWFENTSDEEPEPVGPGAAPPAGGLHRFLSAQSDVAFVEFGTYSMLTVFDALGTGGAAPSDQSPSASLRRMAYPDADDWKRAVWSGADRIIRQAVAGLAKT